MDIAEQARERILGSQRLFVVSGAGISAASGIPTFRGEGGLWRGFRAEELATVAAFEADPRRVWEWYRWRRGICRSSSPNAGHESLVVLESRLPSFFLATQNVDGLHAEAGTLRQVELHGSIDKIRCTSCQWIEPNLEDPENPPHALPQCSRCGAFQGRILWFGETYWPGVMEQALQRRSEQTSVWWWAPRVSVASNSLALASKRSGALLIEVNPEETVLTDQADLSFRLGAQELLPAFLK